MMDYSTIFNRRGHHYHLAMKQLPAARRREFEALFGAQPLKPWETLYDIPSRGGYLERYLEVPASITSFEFSQGFAAENKAVQLLPADQLWGIGKADRVVSLSYLHHNEYPLQLMARLKAHVRPGGWLHVADVAADSRIARFLESFVASVNPMGYDGIFLPVERGAYPRNWDVRRLEVCACPWQFASMEEMLRFCKLLFGLRADCDDALTEALSNIVGIAHTAEGLELQWELLYLDVCCD